VYKKACDRSLFLSNYV